jgi:peptide/nickel transport system substrate-binding protein
MYRTLATTRVVSLVGFVALLLAACAGQSGPATPMATAVAPVSGQPAGAPAGAPSPATKPSVVGAGRAGGTFTIAELGPLPKTLHPYPDSATYTDAWTSVASLLWSGGLLDLDATTLEYVPYLASTWDVSPDGKTFTFTLRDGLKWSDGQPITVDDFLFAWQNASLEENDFVGLEDLQRINACTAPDPKTLVIALKETLARDVAIAVVNTVVAVPKHVWEGKPWGDPAANPEILRPTVVSGPYLLKEWKDAESATLVRNPNWFNGSASFDQIVLKPGQQPTVAYELLKSGQAQWARQIPPSQYGEAKQNPNVNMLEWTAANSAFRVLDFNLQNEFLKDKRVREALARALNRPDVIQVAELNLGQPQYAFLNPSNTRWFASNVEHYDFDLNRARQLLQEAGYRLEGGRLLDSANQPIRLTVLYPVSSGPRAKIAAYLQQQYKQLGIDIEVKGLDANAYFEEAKQKHFDLSLNTWGGGSIDPDTSKSQLVTGGTQNYTGFSNPTVDDLFKRGASELDETKRKQLYDQVQQLVSSELPSFYLYSLTSFSPVSKQLLGVQPNKLDRLDYNDALTRWSLAQ